MTQPTYTLTPSAFADAVKAFADQKNFIPPPPGEYVSSIKDASFRWDEKRQPYVYVLFQVDEGEYEKKVVGRRYYIETAFEGAALGAGQFFALWTDAGLTTEALQGADLVAFAPKLIGCKILIVVKTRKSKDGTKEYTDVNHTKPFDPNAVSSATATPDAPFIG